MATVTFSAADDVLYAYLAGEIDHDAAQNLRIQLDDALLNRTPRTLGGTLRIQHAPEALRRVLQLANIPCVGGESGETI